MSVPVIIDAVRTPFGRRGGAYRETRPDSLLAHAIDGLIERSGVSPAAVNDVICGTVTQAGEQGANIGRIASLLSRLPASVPGVTLNRMCGSSQQAVHFAAQAIAAGDAVFVIACGVESMTRVRMFSDIDPDGHHGGFGGLNPDLLARHDIIHQGESAERMAAKWNLSRAELDDYSIESHRRAWHAHGTSRPAGMLPTPGMDEAGAPCILDRDEGIRERIDPAKMASLPTVFRPEGGVVTAGNASQISDGAAALLIADEDRARAQGLRPKARFRARVALGSDPTLQLDGVIPATSRALAQAGLDISDVDWIEINEAFASVVLAWAHEFDPDMARVNPWGGAIAHGHPLGATGAGLMAKMIAGLAATGGTFGLQVMCAAHGMAVATVIERI